MYATTATLYFQGQSCQRSIWTQIGNVALSNWPYLIHLWFKINCQYKWSASGKKQWLTNSAVSVLEINCIFWTLNWWLLILSPATLNSQLCSSDWKHTTVTEDYQLLFMWCQNGYLLFDHKHWPLSPQVSKAKLESYSAPQF